jgi:hypothetical protein
MAAPRIHPDRLIGRGAQRLGKLEGDTEVSRHAHGDREKCRANVKDRDKQRRTLQACRTPRSAQVAAYIALVLQKVLDFPTAREWRNGRRAGLRIQCRKAWGFKSPLSQPPYKSTVFVQIRSRRIGRFAADPGRLFVLRWSHAPLVSAFALLALARIKPTERQPADEQGKDQLCSPAKRRAWRSTWR